MISDVIANGEIFFLFIVQFHPGYCNAEKGKELTEMTEITLVYDIGR